MDAVITVVVLAGLLAGLATGRVPPAAGVIGSGVVLLLTGVITPEQAFSGFANDAVITIAALYVVAHAVQRAGVLDAAVRRLMPADAPTRTVLGRLLVPVAAASAVLNNTPIVAASAPAVFTWSTARGHPPSRYLMPLSYATILGGTLTTIGTSTNLVVSGLLAERGLPAFGLFTLTPISLPVAVFGVALLVVSAARLLPDRAAPGGAVAARPREHMASFRVTAGGDMAGRRIADAGLRHLTDGYLATIQRGDRTRVAAHSDTLQTGDVVTFVGAPDGLAAVLELAGLEPAEAGPLADYGGSTELLEAIIGAESALVGRTLADIGFRERYAAAVLSVHRDGQPLTGRLGTQALRAGDALLLFSEAGFKARWGSRDDFALLVPLARPQRSVDGNRVRLTVAVVAATVVSAAAGIVPILYASLFAVLVLIALRVLTVAQARDAVDVDVLLVVGGSFALGSAMDVSGLADAVAGLATGAAGLGGRLGGVVAVILATMLLTEPLSNAAAAALMLPVSLQVAGQLDADPVMFAAGVAIAASTSFLTPIGYQTNTMVYGLGGYRFGDYARLGLPLTLLSFGTVSLGVFWTAW